MPEVKQHIQDIKDWLASTGRDRAWLAEQIGSTKGTVDQWFSKGFPKWARQSISNLMQSRVLEGNLRITLTSDEWEEIDQACTNAGYLDRQSFYRDAIIDLADRINADRSRILSARAAEDPAVFGIPNNEKKEGS